MRRITIDQARRYALAAQGFDRDRPRSRLDRRHFRRVIDSIGMVQLDSVNVFSRSHYMPFFSRIGPYDRGVLDAWLWRSREMFEYWGHEASLIPVRHRPLWRWRMKAPWSWSRVERIKREDPDYLERVLHQVRVDGPLRTRDLDDPGTRDPTSMWGWSKGKVALEALFQRGDISVHDRINFTRLYAASEDVIPKPILARADLPRQEAQTELLDQAALSMGVATLTDLADYPRLKVPQARGLVDQMVRDGRLVEVEVSGWEKTAYLSPGARLPTRVEGRALLSPFDNLIWCRPRVERLWDFRYRIEIYVPEAKRTHGYYVLPFLLDGELVARVDLKTDRQRSVLVARGAWPEPNVDLVRIGRELKAELETVAQWLGMNEVEVADSGELAPYL